MSSLVPDPDVKRVNATSENGIKPDHGNNESSSSTIGNESQREGHYGSSDDHVFADPATADYWRLKYEKAGYENRHRFDPELKWTAAEEKKLVRKVCLMPFRGPGGSRLRSFTRLIGGSCCGLGSCSAPWISIVETSIAPSRTTW